MSVFTASISNQPRRCRRPSSQDGSRFAACGAAETRCFYFWHSLLRWLKTKLSRWELDKCVATYMREAERTYQLPPMRQPMWNTWNGWRHFRYNFVSLCNLPLYRKCVPPFQLFQIKLRFLRSNRCRNTIEPRFVCPDNRLLSAIGQRKSAMVDDLPRRDTTFPARDTDQKTSRVRSAG